SHAQALPIENRHLRSAAWPGDGNHVGETGAVEVAAGHANAAHERRCGGEEAGQLRAVLAAPDGDLWPATLVRTNDDVREAVAIDAARCYIHAAGEETRQGIEAPNRLERLAVEDGDLGSRAGAGADDDVVGAVAVDIADGHAYSAGEERGEGVEGGD